MSKLEKLVKELCPDGVEYRKVKEVFRRLKGTPVTAAMMKKIAKPDGEIRIFAGGKTMINADIKDIPKANIINVPAVLVQSRGVIDVIYYEGPFTFKNEMWAYTASEKVSVKFLYYILKNSIQQFRDAASGMGSLPQISLPITEEFLMPFPPLPVQQEVVRILDDFTESTQKLTAELFVEIEARRKQYEYYRGQLLSFPEKPSYTGRLEELIQELCPDGIEYKRLEECCYLEKGKTPIQKAIPGEYPLVVTTEERKSSNEYQFDAPAVCVPLVSSRGHGVASLNQVYYQEGKFALGNILCGITPKDRRELSARFLYQYLNYKKDTLIVPLMKGGANVSLTVDSLKSVKIPVPPMEVQREIAQILSRFITLSEELKKELAARKKQYEYYRDMLFSFDALEGTSAVEWRTIEEVCRNITSGGTPQSKNAAYYGGEIPWLRTQEIDWADIYDTQVKITNEGLMNSSAKWIPKNCVIVAMYGATAAKVAVNKIPLTTNQACCNLEIDDSKALYRYVFHWLSKEYRTLKSLGQGSQSNINAQIIRQYPIPLPSLAIQQRIVNILDRFDVLCNDLTSGLPAEIEARRKQYEYYQNKLLFFPEK